MGDTDLCPWDTGTFGSLATRVFGPALRAAGAEARAVLLELASGHLKIPAAQLSVENGTVFDRKNKSHRVTYAQLAKGKKIEHHVAKTLPKKPSEFKIMNRPVTRRDAQEKVTAGQSMPATCILRACSMQKYCAPRHGAKLLEVDLSGVRQVEGLR